MPQETSQSNELLRAARERVESPSCPGESLTRQELADLVNAQVYRATQKVTAVDANHVGKWEGGKYWWPAAHYRDALRTILDVSTDAELGFRRPARGNPKAVDRKTFLKSALGAGAGVLAARHLPGPAIDADDLAAAIMGPTAHYRRMESVRPPWTRTCTWRPGSSTGRCATPRGTGCSPRSPDLPRGLL